MAENVVTQKQELSVEDAFSIVGINPETTNPTLVLTGFEIAWKGNPSDRKQLILAKNLVLRQLVSEQMKRQRYFEIVSPFEHSCIWCRGTGEIYKFNKKPVEVNCHICAGKGEYKDTCPSCKGSNRYIVRWPEGGGMNLVCNNCIPEEPGKAMIKCSNCLNKGKIKKIVPDHTIKSTTPCKRCHELGFILPKPAKKEKKTPHIGTPVLDSDTAATLSEMIKQ